MMPFLWIFSMGDFFLHGVSKDFRPSIFNWAGFVWAAMCQYAFFFPVYLLVMVRAFVRHQAEKIELVHSAETPDL